jgi:hypothetical protein
VGASPQRGPPFPRHLGAGSLHGHGSITGSIAEEDEDGSSGDEATPRVFTMHENKPGSRLANGNTKNGSAVKKPSPLGVPATASRVSAYGGNDSDSDAPQNSRAGGRRAASDIGAPMGYHPPTGRTPLRRVFSSEEPKTAPRPGSVRSDGSSYQGKKKKKGFFASISKFFKGPKASQREGSIRSGRSSPPYGSSPVKGKSGAWHTRTESNIKSFGGIGGKKGRRSGNDSSSDDEAGNFVSVTNNRGAGWSAVENAGRPVNKRHSSGPIASGLIPKARPTRSELGGGSRADSASTVTARNTGSVRAMSPTPSGTKTPTGALSTVSRSNTVRSTASAGTTGTVTKRTRKNGSISRATAGNTAANSGAGTRTIMSLIDAAPPVMPEVAKAPRSQVSPQMELPKAPGSSIPSARSSIQPTAKTASVPAPASSKSDMTRSNTTSTIREPLRPTTPSLPPSKSLQAPLKSAMRPTSPQPNQEPLPPLEVPTTLVSISAPGPVQLPVEEKKAVSKFPPPLSKSMSYASTTTAGDDQSIYESAVEEDGENGRGGDSSSDEEEVSYSKGYKVVENDKVSKAGEAAGPGEGKVMIPAPPPPARAPSVFSDKSDDTATGINTAINAGKTESVRSRRKSVRMNLPDSPTVETTPRSGVGSSAPAQDRTPSPLPPQTQTHSTIINGTSTALGAPVTSTTTPSREAQWSTRIGRMREDSSDDEDGGRTDEYTKSRNKLLKNSGNWEAVEAAKEKDKAKKRASVAGSAKGSTRGSVKGGKGK